MIDVLIIEDDYHVASIHSAYVRRVEGFRVVGQASTLASGRRQVREVAPDLVLLDLFLPDGSGLELLEEPGVDPAQRPDVLVVTAARDMASVRAAIRLGAVHYLVKPFDFAQIEERLHAYRAMHRRLERIGDSAEREAEQHDVDALYSLLRGPAGTPRSQEGPTLALIQDLLRGSLEDFSAAEIAREIGISRSTAQRYLAELARRGRVEVRPAYGAPGRPENRYRITGQSPSSTG
ncbi:MAG TPA: response regulator [Solirubrobacteraceae bacterium]|nr:response regulator [Solirubrobacteraceae bacterium]